MGTFIEFNKTFAEALRFKYDFDTESKKRGHKYRAIITRQKWVDEDGSFARVMIHPNLSIKISRVNKKGRRSDNSLKIEDYLANDWKVYW